MSEVPGTEVELERRDRVRRYWEERPIGSGDVEHTPGTPEFYRHLERRRYRLDPFMHDVAGFDRWRGKRVLEVGCGVGTDGLQFVRAGADYVGMDLTAAGAGLTRRSFELEQRPRPTLVGDAEHIPFPDDHFDLVYSWGVIHHSPTPARAAAECVRVCRPGGRVLATLYNRRSLFALQAWLYFGLLRGRPWKSPAELIATSLESPGTRAYTPDEALALFPGLEEATVEPIVTRFDLRIGRRLFLPGSLTRLVPKRLGWYLVVRGIKKTTPTEHDPVEKGPE